MDPVKKINTSSKDVRDLIESGFKIGMLQHPEEVTALTMFVAGLAPRNFMEIGSWKGGLFYILCNLSEEGGFKISLDLDAYEDLPGTMQERNSMMSSWADNVHTIVGDSHSQQTSSEVSNILGGDRLDFLLIDGDHSYEGCRRDYEMYSGLVGSGGWIAFHDINDSQKHRLSGCMVSRFWNELEGEKLTFTMGREWGGIGLIRR